MPCLPLAHDEFFGCSLDGAGTTCKRPTIRQQLTITSGYNCTTGNDCLQADGPGWYAVEDSEAGHSNHCYAWSACCSTWNTKYSEGSPKWAMDADLSWLAAAAKTK